ncbi:hypothetical protein LXL04_023083 [Taraxacum kok-saghyz]
MSDFMAVRYLSITLAPTLNADSEATIETGIANISRAMAVRSGYRACCPLQKEKKRCRKNLISTTNLIKLDSISRFQVFLSSAEVDVNEYRTYNRDTWCSVIKVRRANPEIDGSSTSVNFGGNAIVRLVFTSPLLLTNVEVAPEEDFALLGRGEAPLEEDFITSFWITNALNPTIYGYSSRLTSLMSLCFSKVKRAIKTEGKYKFEVEYSDPENTQSTNDKETNEQNSVIGNIKNIQQSGTIIIANYILSQTPHFINKIHNRETDGGLAEPLDPDTGIDSSEEAMVVGLAASALGSVGSELWRSRSIGTRQRRIQVEKQGSGNAGGDLTPSAASDQSCGLWRGEE